MPVVVISSASEAIGEVVAARLSERLGAILFGVDATHLPAVRVSPFEFAMNSPHPALRTSPATAILEAAASGNVVILDARAAAVLRPVDQVLSVHLGASTPEGTGDQPAGDAADPGLFDVVLNVDRVCVDQCVDLLSGLAGNPAFQPTAATIARLTSLSSESRQRDTRDVTMPLQQDDPAGARMFASEDLATRQVPHDELLTRAEAALYGRNDGDTE